MTELNCKKCTSTLYVKSGHVRGLQRYKCKDCGCQFTATKVRGVNPALKFFIGFFSAAIGLFFISISC